MAPINLFKKLAGVFAAMVALFVMSGCETTPANGPVRPPVGGTLSFKKGELVTVAFSGVEPAIPLHEERVKEDGTITLTLIGSVKAEGVTAGQLADDIRRRYVAGGYYQPSLNVTVKSPDRYFTVGGEVRSSNRYPWVEGMTAVKAIQNAGYFTEFGKRKFIVTGQDGQRFFVDYDAALNDPSKDVPVYPGDSIDVPRKW
jgi:polysaccharide export outer membrane protein